jgi:predicted amidohydrolase
VATRIENVRVALIQTEIDGRVPFAERVAGVVEQVARVEADLVLLPELWATGYFAFDDYAATAEPLDGPTVAALSAAAKRAGVTLHGGSIVERDGDAIHNTSLLFGPDGTLLHTYRKVHLFGYGSREQELLTPGTATAGTGEYALSTCYDLRFPELFRAQVDAGSTVFLVAAAWPLARLAHWQLLLRSRALENQSYLLACNAAGHQGPVALAGRSAVVDPWGEVVAEAGAGAEVLLADIDPDLPARARAEFPALADRRL